LHSLSVSHAIAFDLSGKDDDMEEPKRDTKHKGGRPTKPIKRNKLIGVRCSATERFIIEAKAKATNISVSEFLRTLALKGQVDTRIKAIPKEVLQAVASINHVAANVNQIAKKRNGFDELNAIERAELQFIVGQLKQFVKDFKNYFQ
jgi:hypothetical protein